MEEPGRIERQPLQLPAGFDVAPVPPDRTLVQELLDGSIDAITAPRAPRAFRVADGGVRRLLPDYAAREAASFDRTRIFPIMHMVVVRRELADAEPWLPTSLYKALRMAKAVALDGLADRPALAYSIPFLLAALEDSQARFGDDPWPYGLEANRHVLEAFVELMREQGLLAGPLDIDDLFHPGTRRESRI